MKNRKTGSFERFLSLFSVLTNRSERLWKLIVRWKTLVVSLSALAGGLSLAHYTFQGKQQVTEQHFQDGSVMLTNPIRATPLQRTLPDGTRVTLAYSSFMHFSTQQDGKTREVTIGGEAEFEVAPDIRPFIVHAGSTDIRVLGTHFNVMNYAGAGESTTITLLSGRVRVSNSNGSRDLKPSEQAIVQDGQIRTKTLDHPESCLDWAYDPPYFSFENDSLNRVLREVGRWYDVKISNPENLSGNMITGPFPRSFTLEAILECIKLTQKGAGLKIENKGDTIYVTKLQ